MKSHKPFTEQRVWFYVQPVVTSITTGENVITKITHLYIKAFVQHLTIPTTRCDIIPQGSLKAIHVSGRKYLYDTI